MPSNALAYSELIIYGACLTGAGGETADNLVTATYRNNDAKTVWEVCIDTDEVMQDNPLYEYTDSEGNLISLRNYVIAGEREFP